MTTPRGIVGFALYLEMNNEGHTSQMLFTPAFADVETRQLVQPQFIGRQISEAEPKKKWKYTDFEVEDIHYDIHTNTLDEMPNARTAYESMKALYQRMETHLIQSIRQGWKWTGEPLVLEVTVNDAKLLRTSTNPPDALIRRIKEARADAGYPTDLYAKTEA